MTVDAIGTNGPNVFEAGLPLIAYEHAVNPEEAHQLIGQARVQRPTALDPPAREALVQDMAAFIRMYEPHEAREDTVVFPALRDVLEPKDFRDLAERFEDEEHQRFGQAGFQGVVERVADIEKSLDIYDLSKFTPA